MNRRTIIGAAALTSYTAMPPLANLLITHAGMWPVWLWPAILAPAGVYAAGLALVLRDIVHEYLGWQTALAALAAGALISYLIADPQIAVASAAAFGLSELADLGVYARLRRRGLGLAVAASGAVGLIIDSLLFLAIAFGSLQFLPGQLVGKTWMTLAGAATIAALHRQRARQAATA
jgi:uncharacterized PurR-regulated membrane protein YhhQ (DUF165 family)